MARILVTGGAGFIGSNLSESLLARGFEVRIIDTFSTGREKNLKNVEAELIKGSITDMETVKEAIKDVDYVLHQAALPSVSRSVKDPILSTKTNIMGTLNLLVASRDSGVKRMVFASSSSIYGDSPTLPKKEDMPPNPLSPYALTKYAAEKYMQLFYSLYGFETVALRYFNVFGPKQDPTSQYSAVIPLFISKILAGESPMIDGDGEQTRDFTYIKDVVQANILAMQTKKGLGEVFNIAYGDRISINQLKDLICEITGKNVQAIYRDPRPGDIKHSIADVSKAKEILGFRPEYTLKKALEETVMWYENELRTNS